jgi:hypothetical protein
MFQPILPEWVAVGKALIREMFVRIKDNFNDHESRINTLEFSSVRLTVFNNDVVLAGAASTLTGLAYFKAPFAFRVLTAEVQIFQKGSIASGTLEIDVRRNTTPDNTGMTSIFSVRPSVNFATASDYDSSTNQIIDPVVGAVDEGDILRLDVSSLPTGLGKFRIVITGGV